MDKQFIVNILDGSDAKIGEGPIFNVLSVEITEELDRAGKVSIPVPATDERALDLLATGQRMRVKTVDGAICYGIIEDVEVSAGEKPVMTISGPDTLGELVFPNTGYDRVYDNLDVASEILGTDATATSLLGGTGWTQGSVDSGLGDASIVYDGETILQAISSLAKQLGKHFRQGGTLRTLDFGAFGADSGLRITNVHHVLVDQEDTEDLAYVGRMTVRTVRRDVENRIFPLRKYKADLRDASTTITDILVRRNPGPAGASSTLSVAAGAGSSSITVVDGSDFVEGEILWLGDADDWTADHETKEVASVAGNVITFVGTTTYAYGIGVDVIQRPEFYVEDTSSQSSYELRENSPQFNEIEAVDESATAKRQAADMLYSTAKARLAVMAEPHVSYDLGTVYKVPADLRVGQTVRLVYKGMADVYGGGSLYVDVDDDFYVIKITRYLEANGKATASLDLANVLQTGSNDGDMVVNAVTQTRRVGSASAPADIEAPVGCIVIWSGSVGSIPTGWQLCDGTNGTPDLQDRFIVGAGSSYSVGDTGGAATNNLEHNHGAGTLAMGAPSTLEPVTAGGVNVAANDHVHTMTGNTGNAGSTTQENRPPYYALAFIMRVS